MRLYHVAVGSVGLVSHKWKRHEQTHGSNSRQQQLAKRLVRYMPVHHSLSDVLIINMETARALKLRQRNLLNGIMCSHEPGLL
jgi:hypothetical protein